MGKECTITLTENKVGQVLDGLVTRAESWEKTAEFMRSGSMPEDEVFIVEECSDADEADAIASQYRLIMRKMKSQLETQE
jgi:hypothetical protein